MAVPSFLFGGSTNETPASIKQKRDLVRALMGASNAPRNVGEGLNALGDGIVANVLDRRASKAEEAGTSAANSLFNSIIGGSPSTSGASGSAMPTASPSGTIPPVDLSGNDVYNGFIDTVKGGITNPFGLAAVAATGRAESGFDPKNASRTWSDPSESGKAGTAGGIMSWRGPRYDALAATGDLSPAGQGKFFLQEDPALVAKLNSAKSVDEAQGLMNRAWAFRGYDKPGGEAARRLGYANSFLPKFQGQSAGQEVASLDPGAGMPAEQAIQQQSPLPQAGYIDPKVTTAARAPMQSPAPALPAPSTVQAPPPVQAAPQPPQQVAQAAPQGGVFGGVDPRLLQALQNPFLNEGQKSAVQLLIQQQQQAAQQQQEQQTWIQRQKFEQDQRQADPAYQLGLRKTQSDIDNTLTPAQQDQQWRDRQTYEAQQKQNDPAYKVDLQKTQAELDQLQHGPGDVKVVGNQLVRVGRDGQVTDITPKAGTNGSGNGGFRFNGNAVDAQALNGLIDSGQITAEQAQQIAAGKTITGPNGEMMFLTPQSIFGQSGGQPAPQQGMNLFPEPAPTSPQNQGIDLFAGQSAPGPAQAPPAVQAPMQNGPIQLTPPKAPNEAEKSAAGYADRMTDAAGQLNEHEAQGLNATDQFLTQSPFIPGFLGNGIVGRTNPDYQLFDQARRNFINSQLRRESGAVISPEEFDNANKQYFPQPGDSKDVIDQKRANRERAVSSMIRDAGATYTPPAPTPKKIKVGGYTIEEAQ
jgi:hypothetical protein